MFQNNASAPPGRSTRRASGTDCSGVVQWNAWAYVTRSAEPSGNGSAWPSARTNGISGLVARSWAAMPGVGSTATTSAPRSRSSRVEMPVPAPTSSTLAPLSGRPVSSSIASNRLCG